jgi:hypothetical protein
MTDEKQPIQADGSGTEPRMVDENGELAARRGEGQAGESGGGPYPNPHSGKDASAHGPDKLMGHGGQSEQAYYGGNQLGERKMARQSNAGSRES